MAEEKEKMTIDKLAEMSQKEFTAIHGEMAEMKGELKEDISLLRRDMGAGFGSLAEVLKEIRADVKDIKSDVMTVNEDYAELRTRIERLEKKVGLSGQR